MPARPEFFNRADFGRFCPRNGCFFRELTIMRTLCRSSQIIVQIFVRNAARRSCGCAGVSGPAGDSATTVARARVGRFGYSAPGSLLYSFSSECWSDVDSDVSHRH